MKTLYESILDDEKVLMSKIKNESKYWVKNLQLLFNNGTNLESTLEFLNSDFVRVPLLKIFKNYDKKFRWNFYKEHSDDTGDEGTYYLSFNPKYPNTVVDYWTYDREIKKSIPIDIKYSKFHSMFSIMFSSPQDLRAPLSNSINNDEYIQLVKSVKLLKPTKIVGDLKKVGFVKFIFE